jgi:hypothetical protein
MSTQLGKSLEGPQICWRIEDFRRTTRGTTLTATRSELIHPRLGISLVVAKLPSS